jgi:hypothetical protein
MSGIELLVIVANITAIIGLVGKLIVSHLN